MPGKRCPSAPTPSEAGEAVNAVLEVCDAVARWSGVGRRGDAARSGDAALLAGRRLHAPQIALAASLGVTHLNVRCRPDVALGIAGAKPPAIDALGAAIAALVARDGGAARLVDGDVARALPADVVVMAGRSGWGGDDHAVQSIEATGGRIDHHGLAVIPGGSSGLGWLGAAPLVLLPGDPLSALVAYELLAGRLIRRLAGRATTWPYPTQRFALSRKIASAIGMAEWVPVTCDGSIAEPLAWPPADGLAGFANADGFHLVSAGLEGYAAGALIDVVLMSGNTGITKEC